MPAGFMRGRVFRKTIGREVNTCKAFASGRLRLLAMSRAVDSIGRRYAVARDFLLAFAAVLHRQPHGLSATLGDHGDFGPRPANCESPPWAAHFQCCGAKSAPQLAILS